MKKLLFLSLFLISLAVVADPGPIRLRENVIDARNAGILSVSEMK